MRTLTTLLGSMLLLGGLACSDTGTGDSGESDDMELDGEELLSKSFRADAIIEDIDMTDASALSASEIDEFLERPYPDLHANASCLSNYRSGGKTVGQLIAERAKKYQLNPIFLLAHLQKESSLVGTKGATCPTSKMTAAFGCGCPDGKGCSAQFAGFVNQLECASKKTREFMDDLNNGGATISGWRLNKPTTTLDKRSISPKTKATAVLYTYTPWVGDKTAGGNKAPFGNYLFWKVWLRYANTLGYAGLTPGKVTPACTSDKSCTGGKAGTGKVCSTSGATLGMCVTGCRTDNDCAGDKVCVHTTAAGECVAPDTSSDVTPLGESCSSNDECSGGLTGQERVCGSSSGVCIVGCGSDNDCPDGKTCDRSLPKWSCVADE